MPAELGQRAKDPGEVVDYTIDWTDILAGATISTSSWNVEAGLTKDSDSNSTTSTTVVLSGGTAGRSYSCTNTITTSTSRTRVRSFRVVCREL